MARRIRLCWDVPERCLFPTVADHSSQSPQFPLRRLSRLRRDQITLLSTVKARLALTVTNYDSLLTSAINAVSGRLPAPASLLT